MRYPPHLLDEIRARLPVSGVVARKVALKKKGREYAGLSPFKSEKTASFFVNDQKGFYHCFASGEHGDIFTFLMKTEGLSFPEAVERLAEEAGVPLPAKTERDEQREDDRVRLYRLLETAQAYFETALKRPEGAEARRYLARRGLAPETITRFRLGYAPNSRSALKEHLSNAGFTADDMARSGMLISGDDIPVAYDRFRNRVMFPITDLKDRVIAFGGRALDPDQPAKYLNSPETPLFHKGHVLFNAARARPLAFERERLIAVEGYMDVVALAEAGFGEAVAPLGTALTEDQVKLMWRMVPEPILCFDGDSAGRKAAHRAIETVMPNLRPGISVSFAFLPDGLDPDDLIRQQGAAAFETVLGRARPLAEVLFEREWLAGEWTTPERRARLEQRLREIVATIADAAVRDQYERDMRQRLYAMWGRSGGGAPRWDSAGRGPAQAAPASRNRPGYAPAAARGFRQQPSKPGMRGATPPPPRPTASESLRASAMVAGEASAPPYREVLLLRTLLVHPWLIDDQAEALAGLTFTSEPLNRLRDALLSAQAQDIPLDSSSLRTQLDALGVGRIVDLVDRSLTHHSDKFAEPDATRDEVEVGWRHTLALHEHHVDLRQALLAAEREWREDGNETALARICEIQRQIACVNELGGLESDGSQHGSQNGNQNGSPNGR
ncbi:MAG: DNA primase [Hyphomicrobiaceae bacterium]|nr:DNA primase [Hyphomicrobiaceae bacterium]